LRPLHGHCLHTLHVLSFFAIQFLKNSIVATSHHNVTPQRAPSLQHRNITSQCNKLHCCNTAMQCRSEFHRYDAVAQRRPSLQCHVYHHYKAHGHYSWQPPHYQTSCYNVTTVSSCCIAKCHVVSRCNQHLINVTVDIIFDIRSNVVLWSYRSVVLLSCNPTILPFRATCIRSSSGLRATSVFFKPYIVLELYN
jgi:hypothetical protein